MMACVDENFTSTSLVLAGEDGSQSPSFCASYFSLTGSSYFSFPADTAGDIGGSPRFALDWNDADDLGQVKRPNAIRITLSVFRKRRKRRESNFRAANLME